MDTKVAKPAARRTRRRHDPEFKAQVIEACLQPGVSVAGVALANGLNANYLRRWVKEHREQIVGSAVKRALVVSRHVKPTTLVPARIETPVTRESGEIRIDLRRGGVYAKDIELFGYEFERVAPHRASVDGRFVNQCFLAAKK